MLGKIRSGPPEEFEDEEVRKVVADAKARVKLTGA